MMMNRLRLLLLVSLLLLLPALAGAVEVGKPAPGFTLKTLEEQSVSLADFKGKVVLLKLATTWCPSCAQLSKELDAIGEFLKTQDVVLIEVFLQDTPEMVERYLAGKNFPMVHKVLIDDMQVYKGYGIYTIPRFLVVDKEQKVRYDNGNAATILPAAEIKKLVEATGT
jgi:thiol-disulfide isomerase/thioredoxin